jgi:hypothetical protein
MKAKQASGSCDACYNWRLFNNESSFGAALFFTGGVAFNAGKHEPDAARRARLTVTLGKLRSAG